MSDNNEYDMPEYVTEIDGHEVTADKVGGGTLGCRYEGTWIVTVDGDAMPGLLTGMPKTHADVARIAFEVWAEGTHVEPSEDAYDELLDEVHEPYRIGDMEFHASDILKSCDPIAYRIGYSEYVDSRVEDWKYGKGIS